MLLPIHAYIWTVSAFIMLSPRHCKVLQSTLTHGLFLRVYDLAHLADASNLRIRANCFVILMSIESTFNLRTPCELRRRNAQFNSAPFMQFARCVDPARTTVCGLTLSSVLQALQVTSDCHCLDFRTGSRPYHSVRTYPVFSVRFRFAPMVSSMISPMSGIEIFWLAL